MNMPNYSLRDWSDSSQDWEYKKKYRDNTPQISPEAFYSDHNRV